MYELLIKDAYDMYYKSRPNAMYQPLECNIQNEWNEEDEFSRSSIDDDGAEQTDLPRTGLYRAFARRSGDSDDSMRII